MFVGVQFFLFLICYYTFLNAKNKTKQCDIGIILDTGRGLNCSLSIGINL